MRLFICPHNILDDCLQFPVTLPLPRNRSPSGQAETLAHPRIHNDDNVSIHFFSQHFALTTFLQSRLAEAPHIIQHTPATPSTVKARLRYMSNWWFHTGRTLPPMMDVPFVQGEEVTLAGPYHCL